jgi:hypothetical protein
VDVERWRPRLEHAQIMTVDDLERIGRLGGGFPCRVAFRQCWSLTVAFLQCFRVCNPLMRAYPFCLASQQNDLGQTAQVTCGTPKVVSYAPLPPFTAFCSHLPIFKGPERIKGAYAYRSLLKSVPPTFLLVICS